jgi:AcrR family transcriptional regulator
MTENESDNLGARKALLDYAKVIIRTKGVNALRTQDVLKMTKTSFSSLYHHFGSREGLVHEARMSLVTESFASNVTRFNEACFELNHIDQMAHLVAATFNEISVSPVNYENRIVQSALIGSITHDPLLRTTLVNNLGWRMSALKPAFNSLAERKVISATVNIDTYITVVLIIFSSRTFIEHDPKLASLAVEWNKMMISGVVQALSPQRKLPFNPAWELRSNNPLPDVEDRNKFVTSVIESAEKPATHKRGSTVKSKVLASTINLLSLQGAEGIKIEEIAHDCQIAPSGIYKYYSNRSNLITQAQNVRVAQAFEKMNESIPFQFDNIKKKKDFIRELSDLFESNFSRPDYVRARTTIWEIYGEALTNEEIMKIFTQSQDSLAKKYFELISHYQNAKVISTNFSAVSIAYVLLALDLSSFLYRLFPRDNSREELLRSEWMNFLKIIFEQIF